MLFPLLGIYLLLYPICFELYGLFFTNWISISNFAYIPPAKPRVSAENIGIKVSALPPSCYFYCYSANNAITNLSIK